MTEPTFAYVAIFWVWSFVLLFAVAIVLIVMVLVCSGIMEIFEWLTSKVTCWMHTRRLKVLTWTCHICGEERPDEYISVKSKSLNIPGVDAEQNIRYFNDKPECAEGAETFSFVQGDKT